MHRGHYAEGMWQPSSDKWDRGKMEDCTEHLKKILFLLFYEKIIVPARLEKIINPNSLLGRAFSGIDTHRLWELIGKSTTLLVIHPLILTVILLPTTRKFFKSR